MLVLGVGVVVVLVIVDVGVEVIMGVVVGVEVVVFDVDVGLFWVSECCFLVGCMWMFCRFRCLFGLMMICV